MLIALRSYTILAVFMLLAMELFYLRTLSIGSLCHVLDLIIIVIVN